MRSARQSAIRLLQLMMVASVVLPVVLFAFAAWLNYRHEYAVADDRIERSLDILHEHTLKVFQTVERAIAEVNEIVRGMSDDDIRRDQLHLHERVKHIVDALPQVRAIFLIDRDGRPLVSSQLRRIPSDFSSRERSFFNVHVAGDVGTYVSDVLAPRLTGLSTRFFFLSRRRSSADGRFNGVVAIAVLPQYFEEFYALIGRSPGSLYALLSADGRFLARYPERPDRGLQPGSALHTMIAQGQERSIRTIPQSQIDAAERRVGQRKLEGFPVYVVAGIDSSAIRTEWIATMASHLVFGLPATLFLFLIIGVALRRTRRLHAEAERREAAGAALRQAPRLEAIGPLTRGVAHDYGREWQRAAAAARSDRGKTHASPRHDHECDQSRREPHASIARVLAPTDAHSRRDACCRAAFRAQGHAQPLAPRRYHHRGRGSRPKLRGQGRPERARARLAQSRGQRPRCHAERRSAEYQREAGRAQGQRGRGGAQRRVRRDPLGRYWFRHLRRHSAARVRTVLHDQGGRQGHRIGPKPSLWLRQAVGRHCDHHQHGRARHGDHALSAAHAGAACTFDRAHRTRSHAASGRHGAGS